jgi:hypothetical protein
MENLAGKLEPHALSEVMTGTMFDILKGVFAYRFLDDNRAKLLIPLNPYRSE